MRGKRDKSGGLGRALVRMHNQMVKQSKEKSHSLHLHLDGSRVTTEERRRLQKEEEALYASSLRVPRRPPWNSRMSAEELDVKERQAFLVWRRSLARFTYKYWRLD
ncbi:GTPase LSG1-2-like [Phalaenopsis equestris]|uniref:GTPase LSG1-2-like n=1 Tax=Phalaenopsis equestris TaxID=78828 RepID=UPI0009E1C3DE|nr:GTPase LSG1-2-like [Phalaenopsis equestris]XP_020575637.1 GTPase LSG1-2-like [Phalaenopsis equestris]